MTALVGVAGALRRTDSHKGEPAVERVLHEAFSELEPCWHALGEWLSLLARSAGDEEAEATLFAMYRPRLPPLVHGM